MGRQSGQLNRQCRTSHTHTYGAAPLPALIGTDIQSRSRSMTSETKSTKRIPPSPRRPGRRRASSTRSSMIVLLRLTRDSRTRGRRLIRLIIRLRGRLARPRVESPVGSGLGSRVERCFLDASGCCGGNQLWRAVSRLSWWIASIKEHTSSWFLANFHVDWANHFYTFTQAISAIVHVLLYILKQCSHHKNFRRIEAKCKNCRHDFTSSRLSKVLFPLYPSPQTFSLVATAKKKGRI